MQRAGAATLALIFVLVVPLAQASGGPPSRFEADMVPNGPLLLDGLLQVDAREANMTATWLLPPGVVTTLPFGQNETRYVVSENRPGLVGPLPRKATVGGKAELREKGPLTGSSKTIPYVFGAHNLTILPRINAEVSLPVPSNRTTTPNRALVDARCALVREEGLMLRADCAAPEIHVLPGAILRIVNATVHVTYVVEENGTREERVQVFETGQFSEPDPLVPGRVQLGVRVLYVSVLAGGPAIRMQAATASFRSPMLALEGSLRIPPAVGTARWGSHHVDGALMATEIEGVAIAAPTEAEHGIGIRALTTNHPEVPVMGGTAAAAVLGAAALAAGAVVAAGAALGWKSRFLLVGLFTRITETSLLGHERRRLLLHAVEQSPGLTVGDAAALLGISRSVVQHHVNVLSRSGLLVRMHVGRLTALFLPRHNAQDRPRLQLLRNPLVQRLVSELTACPGLSQMELGMRLSISQAHVSRLLRRIRQVGLLPTAFTLNPERAAPWRSTGPGGGIHVR